MNTRMLSHVRALWNSPHVSPAINRANQRKWVRSVRLLGDKWLIIKHVERLKDANQS
jgi:hypothetical protein